MQRSCGIKECGEQEERKTQRRIQTNPESLVGSSSLMSMDHLELTPIDRLGNVFP